MTLYDAAGEVHDAVTWTSMRSGTSLNRSTDGAAGTELVDHDEVEGAVGAQSPGTRAYGLDW